MDPTVARRLAKAIAKAEVAADGAVGSCNVARMLVESAVVPANHVNVADRDAAASEALEASFRCDAASLAAVEAAALCEAVAEEAAANNHPESTWAAQQARAAAVRCDAEGGAVAASRAANAFADSCVAACGELATLTLAAREAAARCVRARDDASTALLVRQKATTGIFWVAHYMAYLQSAAYHEWVAHCKAHRQSAAYHKEARKDAVAAASTLREAAVRCAAASRGAVSAASVARKIANRCSTGGEEAAAAVAQEAANRCIAEPADATVGHAVPLADAADASGKHFAEAAVGADSAAGHAVPLPDAAVAAGAGPAVPRADLAALKAREAAASCDAALADPPADADSEFLDKMRGWVMAVAALFVGIAFQAMVHPPDGMSFDGCKLQLVRKNVWKAASGAPSPAPAPAPSSAATLPVNGTSPDGWPAACGYLAFNTVTMAMALTMLVLLLIMKKAKSRLTLRYLQLNMPILAISVAGSFITGTSRYLGVQLTTCFVFVLYATSIFIGAIIIIPIRQAYGLL